MKRILLIEDDPDHREMIEHILRSSAAQTTWAPDGQQALSLLSKEKFDLVISDLRLAGMDGLEIVEKVRANPGPNQKAPLIILTAGGGERAEDAQRAGATAVLTKQSLSEIKQTVARFLQA